MIQFDGPHVPIDFAQAVLKKILDERLVVTRTPTGNQYAPLVRVLLDDRAYTDHNFPIDGWVIQQREGGDLRAWRDLLAMHITDIAVDAMKQIGILENSPAVAADGRRTAWQKLVDEGD